MFNLILMLGLIAGNGWIQCEIRDAEQGIPLPSANVVVMGTHLGASSDTNGIVTFKLPEGEYELQTSMLGYERQKIRTRVIAGETTFVKIALHPKPLTFNPIVVTSTRTPVRLANAPIPVEVVLERELELARIFSPAEAIRWVPGVQISGGAPGGATARSTASIDGLPAQYTLVLVDGKRVLSEHIHTGVNLDLIPPSQIERIEVLRGPASALYGSDAIAGVINIITKPLEKSSPFSTRFSYGSYGTMCFSASYVGKLTVPNLYFMISLDKLETDGTKPEDWYDKQNITLKLSSDSWKGKLSYYHGKYESSRDSMLTMDWGYTLGNIKLGAYLSCYERSFREGAASTHNLISELSAEYRKGALLAGFELRFNEFERISTPKHSEWIAGNSVQYQLPLTNKSIGFLALRLDYVQGLGLNAAPKLGIRVAPAPVLNFWINAGRGFRAPSLQDRYEVMFDHGTWWRNGNPNLKPEESYNGSVDFQLLVNSETSLRLGYTYNRIKNMIAVKNTGELGPDGDPVFERENVKEARTQTVRLELMSHPWRSLYLAASYIYLKSKDMETGQPLEYQPKHTLNLRISVSARSIGLNSHLVVENVRDRWYINKEGEPEKMKDYTLVNLNLEKRITPVCTFFLGAYNLLDQKIELYEEEKQLIGAGRTFKFGFAVEF